MTTLAVRIIGRNLAGLRYADQEPIAAGVQRGATVIDRVPGDASVAAFSIHVEVMRKRDSGLDYRGPFVHGRPVERFVYLSWGRWDRRGRLRCSAALDVDTARQGCAGVPAQRHPDDVQGRGWQVTNSSSRLLYAQRSR